MNEGLKETRNGQDDGKTDETSLSGDVSLEPVVCEKNITIEEALSLAGLGSYQWRLLISCAVPCIADAMEVLLMAFITNEAQSDLGCSSWEISLIAAAMFFGQFIGSPTLGYLADRIGRRRTIFIAMVLQFLMGALSALSTQVWMLLVTRMLVGFSIGGLHVCVTLYSEFLPTLERTFPLTLLQAFWPLGSLLQCCLAWAVLPRTSWRYLVAISCIPSFVGIISCWFLPESPRYLLVQGSCTKSKNIILKIASVNRRAMCLPTHFNLVFHESCSGHKKNSLPSSRRVYQLLHNPEMRRLTLCLCTIWFATSFVYCGLVFLTSNLRFSARSPYLSMLLVVLAELPAYVITFLFSMRLGRRRGMILSSAGGVLCTAALSLQDYIPFPATISFMCGSRLCLAVLFALAVLYTPEAFPTQARSTGVGLTMACARFAGIWTPFVAISLHSVQVIATASTYAVILCIGTAAAVCLPFDTHNRPLDDVVDDSDSN